MNPGVSKLAFTSPSMAADLSTPEIASVPDPSDAPILKHFLKRFRSDERLALDMQAGETDALSELYRRHCKLVFNVARRIIHVDGEAEDVVQQVFLDAFRSIRLFRPEKGTFKTWLLMFAYQRTLNHRRALNTAGFFISDPLDDSITLTAAPHSRTVLKNQEAGILAHQLLASLPERQRRIIELVYYEGMTAEEISKHTGETVRVVRHNLYRGLEKLRRSMCDRDAAYARTSGKERIR